VPPVRGFRLTGLIILAFSVVYSAITGDWPSGHSILVRIVVGVAAGVAVGVVLRAMIPREQRQDFIRKTYPRIGARLPPLSERDDWAE
jgi:NhaP-type Na+/H+ or K+/H+ antiporter